MKKTFTLLTAILLSFSLFAFSPQSMLSISSSSSNPISVTIDFKTYTEDGSNDIVVKGINTGYHTIKVYQSRSQRNNNVSRRNNQQLIYTGTIYVRQGYHSDIVINRFGKAYIDERKISSDRYNEDDEGCYDWNQRDNYREAMGAIEFNQFKQAVINSGFDNTKLAIAKQTISRNYFTAAQVKEIVCLFSFDNSKLDIAKAAYRNSIDKNNYFLVRDALSFSSSKEELSRFLETSR